MTPEVDFFRILWTVVNFMLIILIIVLPVMAVVWIAGVNRRLKQIEEQLLILSQDKSKSNLIKMNPRHNNPDSTK